MNDGTMKRLRQPIEDRYKKPVRLGGLEFTSIEVYAVIDRLEGVWGPMGELWNVEMAEGYPQIGKKEVLGFGWFCWRESQDAPWIRIPVGGGTRIAQSTGDALAGVVSRLISKGASYLGVGREVYLEGSADTYLNYEHNPDRPGGTQPTHDPNPSKPTRHRGSSPPPCPKCGEPSLALKQVRKEGPNKGRRFWSCQNKKCNEWVGWEEDWDPNPEDPELGDLPTDDPF